MALESLYKYERLNGRVNKVGVRTKENEIAPDYTTRVYTAYPFENGVDETVLLTFYSGHDISEIRDVINIIFPRGGFSSIEIYQERGK